VLVESNILSACTAQCILLNDVGKAVVLRQNRIGFDGTFANYFAAYYQLGNVSEYDHLIVIILTTVSGDQASELRIYY